MRIENPLLLAEYRLPGPCWWCGKMCRVREVAHLRAKGMGSAHCLDVRINLAPLGSSALFLCACHRNHHACGKPNRRQLEEVVAAKLGTTSEDIRAVMNVLCRLPKEPGGGQIEAEMILLSASAAELLDLTLSEKAMV